MDKSVQEQRVEWCVLGLLSKGTNNRSLNSITGVTFQEVIRSERKEEKEDSEEVSRKQGVTKWLSSAIELENTM